MIFAAALAVFVAYVTVISITYITIISIVEANVASWCRSFDEGLASIFILQNYYIIHTLLTYLLLVLVLS